VRLLIHHGADVNVEDKYGEKPLHKVTCCKYEAQEDGVGVAQLLLERGAVVNTRRMDGSTPLHIASFFGRVEIVRLLIAHNADVNAVDDLGKTPLHDVSRGVDESQENGIGVARLLLDHGADVNAKTRLGYTPLSLVSPSQRPKLAELLEYVANFDGQSPSVNSNQAGH
jgi:ankyrin repeat protein